MPKPENMTLNAIDRWRHEHGIFTPAEEKAATQEIKASETKEQEPETKKEAKLETKESNTLTKTKQRLGQTYQEIYGGTSTTKITPQHHDFGRRVYDKFQTAIRQTTYQEFKNIDENFKKTHDWSKSSSTKVTEIRRQLEDVVTKTSYLATNIDQIDSLEQLDRTYQDNLPKLINLAQEEAKLISATEQKTNSPRGLAIAAMNKKIAEITESTLPLDQQFSQIAKIINNFHTLDKQAKQALENKIEGMTPQTYVDKSYASFAKNPAVDISDTFKTQLEQQQKTAQSLSSLYQETKADIIHWQTKAESKEELGAIKDLHKNALKVYRLKIDGIKGNEKLTNEEKIIQINQQKVAFDIFDQTAQKLLGVISDYKKQSGKNETTPFSKVLVGLINDVYQKYINSEPIANLQDYTEKVLQKVIQLKKSEHTTWGQPRLVKLLDPVLATLKTTAQTFHAEAKRNPNYAPKWAMEQKKEQATEHKTGPATPKPSSTPSPK